MPRFMSDIIADTDNTLADDGSQTVLSSRALKALRNGDIVGTYLSGSMGAAYWQRAKVIGNDTRDGILFVQHGHEPMESFWYSQGDDIILWPTR